MIEITKYEEKYNAALEKMMLMEGLVYKELEPSLGSTFVVVEKGEVLGFGYYNIYEKDYYLDHLYIKKNERLSKLGDSLFRTILNSLFLNSVSHVKVHPNVLYNTFLAAEEIERLDQVYCIDLDEFFNRKCKSERTRKHL